ncbi:MAG: TrpB-like pyridoxal phosphate-dependent enzyme [Candidatus Auribacterota bacterium]
MTQRMFHLPEESLPRQWYNVQADLPRPLYPPIHPCTRKPLVPEDLASLFPKTLIEQEMSTERWIDIPEEIRSVLKIWRPTPLVRAVALEKALKTPAKIFYKDESVSPAGSHKPNTAVAQAYYNKLEGIKRIATETGAGQWGSALAFATQLFGLECTVYMVKVSYQQKPYRRSLMHIWGAEVFPSPTTRTESGKRILEKHPDTLGSLGIAISEAVEDAVRHDDTHYALGSVLNHVVLHQSIEGLEAKDQFAMAGVEPDILIGCAGGGSNVAGFVFPFVPDKKSGKKIQFIAVEPTACPSLTRGAFRYDFGDTAQNTPLMKMFTLGHTFIPSGIHAGGLRYHGMSPLLSLLCKEGMIEARAYHQNPVFEAAMLFARCERVVPAPETAHAIKAVVDEAIKCRETGEAKTIGFLLSGHGHFDLGAYEKYMSNELEDYEHPDEAIKKALAEVPVIEDID